MPTSIEQIQEFLDEFSLNYRVDAERDAILIGFGLDPARTTFRDMDGDPGIQLVIRVLEQGEFLSIFTPQAWCVEDCPHKAAVFETLTSIQTQYKMLRFDYDPSDGEIRPNVELPLEDADLTSRQFHRLLHGRRRAVNFDGNASDGFAVCGDNCLCEKQASARIGKFLVPICRQDAVERSGLDAHEIRRVLVFGIGFGIDAGD
jgi:hypothetical protein